jgi:poly-gamma-glutamate capsule biosynthesis protein CapA/YwtB (metallophosphatase superfamily)
MNDEERGAAPMPRRALLSQAGRAGLGIAASVPLASWLASCATQPGVTQRLTATSAPTAAPTATPDTRPVTIAITGDLMLARSVGQQLLASDGAFPFAYTAEYLRGFDLTVGNLECVVSTLGAPQPKQYTFEAPTRSFERLVTTGFDVVSLANNHSGDYGKEAFADMLGKLPGYGLTPLGGGLNRAAAHAPVIRTVHATTLGFLAYCEIQPQSFAATDSSPGHAWLEEASMRADIQAARPQVDFLIVFQHWGVEYETVESSHQQTLARAAIEAGADLVVGAHPHVIQPHETYQGKPIIYSLGNFVFDLMWGVAAVGNVLALTVQGSRLLDWKLRAARIGDYGQPDWIQ